MHENKLKFLLFQYNYNMSVRLLYYQVSHIEMNHRYRLFGMHRVTIRYF